jgi:hypothetical protein
MLLWHQQSCYLLGPQRDSVEDGSHITLLCIGNVLPTLKKLDILYDLLGGILMGIFLVFSMEAYKF